MIAEATEKPASTTHTTSLSLDNVGPIKHADFRNLPTSGILELRGRKGIGKSTTLRAINSLGNPKEKPNFSIHDRELSAMIEGFGVSMRVGGRTSRKGELALVVLGAVSVDELVDPGIDNPEAADRARIEAIVQMTGQEADPALFYELVGGKDAFERLFPGIDIGETNLVKFAGKVKRALEAEARKAEAAAEQERAKAAAMKQQAQGVDLESEDDEQVLATLLEQATLAKGAIDKHAENAKKCAEKRADAQKKLDEMRAKQADMPTVEQAEDKVMLATFERDGWKARVETLEKELREAKANLDTSSAELSGALNERDSAKYRSDMIAAWETTLNETTIEAPSEEAVAAARQKYDDASAASTQGVKVRAAKAALAKATKQNQNAVAYESDAAGHREAAKGIDGVLSNVVSRLGGKLRVEGDRLVTDTVRGKTLFADLSDGERYEIGIDMLINQRPEGEERNGLGTIQQRAWGEIQPKVKKQLARYAESKGVLLWTAVVTDDEELCVVAV